MINFRVIKNLKGSFMSYL